MVGAFARYGDEGVEVLKEFGPDFVARSERLGVDPTEILVRPPADGQSLEGWLLGITNPRSAVNLPPKLGLSDDAIDAVAEASVRNRDSSLFVIGFSSGPGVPYDDLARKHDLGYFATSDETYALFQGSNAWGDFWQVDAAAMELVMEERKIFVLSTRYNSAIQATNRLTAAEIRLIEKGGYALASAGGVDFLVPVELADSYLSIVERVAPGLLRK